MKYLSSKNLSLSLSIPKNQKIHQLELQESLVIVPKSHPAAKSRYINFPPLTLLPSSLPALLASPATHPTLRGLLPAILREPFRRPNNKLSNDDDDESVYSLVARRFGDRFAREYLTSIIHGIYAADARALSVRATFPSLWNAERQGRGSILRGFIRNAISQQLSSFSLSTRTAAAGTSFLSGSAGTRTGGGKSSLRGGLEHGDSNNDYDIGKVGTQLKGAAMYTFRGGIETLSNALYKSLSDTPNVEIWQGVGAKRLLPLSDGIEVNATSPSSSFSLRSALPFESRIDFEESRRFRFSFCVALHANN